MVEVLLGDGLGLVQQLAEHALQLALEFIHVGLELLLHVLGQGGDLLLDAGGQRGEVLLDLGHDGLQLGPPVLDDGPEMERARRREKTSIHNSKVSPCIL